MMRWATHYEGLTPEPVCWSRAAMIRIRNTTAAQQQPPPLDLLLLL